MAPELRAVGAVSDRILATFSATRELLLAPTVEAQRARARRTLQDWVAHLAMLDELDIVLREAADELSDVQFVAYEARLEEMARTAVAATTTTVEISKSLGVSESSYAAAAEAAREWRMALEWDDEDYANSDVFNRMLDQAVANHEAGKTVEGGSGE